MGSLVEINDTLKISKERGFPHNLHLQNHIDDPQASLEFLGNDYSFWNNDERLYNRPPTRVFLVEEIDGKWLYWGNAHVKTQSISKGKTSGIYEISKIYHPDFQRQMTIMESPDGKSFFPENRTTLYTNNRSSELFNYINQVRQLHPDMRLGQLLCNICAWHGDMSEGAVWDISDEDVVKACKDHIAQRKTSK